MGLFSSHQSIGVDIGHASVRVVGIELGRKPKITGFSEVAVDPKYLLREGFQDPKAIADAIQEAMHTATPHIIKPSAVYASISESQIFRKILELPVLGNAEEYQQVIRTEAAEYLPDSIENVELDYQMLGAVTPEGIQQVMVVAVAKRVIQDYTAVFSSAKLPLRAIDSKPAAVGRAIVAPEEKGAVILVDIGSESCSISVYDQHSIWVTGTVNMGANIFKDADTGTIDEEKLPTRLKQLSNNLLDELDHVLKFYANRTSRQDAVKELRITGGGSLTPGIAEILQPEVGQKVVLAKPIIPVPEGMDRRFNGALGSALYPLYDLI
jgi:type IV pilus assembly protein PilM